MYNDFTGATLFSAHSENNFSFKGLPTFEDGSKVIRLGLTWDTSLAKRSLSITCNY